MICGGCRRLIGLSRHDLGAGTLAPVAGMTALATSGAIAACC
jgi:hypothetical protein